MPRIWARGSVKGHSKKEKKKETQDERRKKNCRQIQAAEIPKETKYCSRYLVLLEITLPLLLPLNRYKVEQRIESFLLLPKVAAE